MFAHRRGHLVVYERRLAASSAAVNESRHIHCFGHTPFVEWCAVAPTVRTEDLIDAHEVAELLGLSQRNSVSTYLKRYDDMPRPVVERSGGRTRLWLRPEIEKWARSRSTRVQRRVAT